MTHADEHRECHKRLHEALDELVTDYRMRTGKRPDGMTVRELLKWSKGQTVNPTPDEVDEDD